MVDRRSTRHWPSALPPMLFTLNSSPPLPEEKRQPNLLFAALRHVCGTPHDWPTFRALLREHAAAVRARCCAPHPDQ